MDHRAGFAFVQGCHQGCTVTDVALHQTQLFPRDAFHPRHCLRVTIAKVVEHRDITACIEQLHAGMRTDIAGATSNKIIRTYLIER